MAKHDFNALLLAYPEVIGKMPSPFLAHTFIQKLSEIRQAEYIEALYEYRHTDRGSFRVVHQRLSAMLSENAAKLKIQKVGSVPSTDIWGNLNECMCFVKI